ncbi:hypothetical protein IV203_030723 [Nitzschia inconspicua]|uniref:No apical meristem-associated C-terminal domain-containing protein n=1 Tax=Nitzschia inconspicua TaxID=303405 RepID=A0A9K3K9I9_9STRA|nr:hypothetical protein IV203_033433 [Nitzschia inconspicua]KAG7339427.1 hypothetical protein IV203_024797 [Nitzschia inconspicua]KAG7350168.1 hypothetical protein IV203_009528 [Nitzschia inconspicua]KAG7352587.1 hypothetical protein IV203_008635 [Nitzschia inconspicua]KAG7353733.1 hypothetical protein IV203_003088 [Nitzschia inconspicua]
MPHGKKWTADECTVAAKAYVAATQDEINGADQTAADFSKRLNSFMKSFSPPACAGTGTYWDRDPDGRRGVIWQFLRDTVTKECQKFNVSLNRVRNANLSGLTEEEKVNVAVASHLRKISVGETLYSYKNFDKISWRFYGAWHVLKDTEKVRAPQQSRLPSEEVASAVDAFDDNSTLSDSPVESPVDDVPVLSVSSKSSRRGRDKAKNDAFFNNILAKKTKILAEIRTEERRKADAMRMNNWLAMLRDPNIPDRLKEIAFENVEEEVQKSRREREGAPGLIPLPPPTAAEAHENDDISADSHGYEGTAAL